MKDYIKTNIVIMGKSIAGLSSALFLTNHKQKIIILEYLLDTLCLSGCSVIFTELNGSFFTGEYYEEMIKNQLETNNDIQYKNDFFIESVEYKNNHLYINLDNKVIVTDSIIFSPNGSVVPPSDLDIERFYGLGISFCAWSDAPYLHEKKVYIYGYSDRVLDQARWLLKYTFDVTLICPTEFSFSNNYKNYFTDELKLKKFENVTLKKLVNKYNKNLSHLIFDYNGNKTEVECEYLFIADPLVANWGIFSKFNEQMKIELINSGKIILTGIVNGIPYSNHHALFLDGKKTAELLIRQPVR